ncbi:MAG: hypothetical protein JO272_04015 [Pseudonocardiales bacterium]|nr:hypothetical protein [Pseudonocardiales bacterium]
MTWQQHQHRVESNALRLDRARGILEKAHLEFILLGDILAAYRLQRIIHNVQAERQRWLYAVGSPLP